MRQNGISDHHRLYRQPSLMGAAVATHELANLLHWYLIVEWQDPTFSNRYSVTHQKLVTALLQVSILSSLLYHTLHLFSFCKCLSTFSDLGGRDYHTVLMPLPKSQVGYLTAFYNRVF